MVYLFTSVYCFFHRFVTPMVAGTRQMVVHLLGNSYLLQARHLAMPLLAFVLLLYIGLLQIFHALIAGGGIINRV